MTSHLNQTSQQFLERLKMASSSTVDLSRLATWICKNTAHPKDSLRMWSFKDHEFQEAILNDDAARVIVRKCSQVGVSELTVRMCLALLAILRNHTAIYTLPTASFASSFTKSRFDPVIAQSPVLHELLDHDIDNVSLKKIGTSFLYILGTFTQGAAISVPADILINDEVDFSNQQALTTFASRLGHAKDGGLRREFSTPTVAGFGISESFDISSQAWYGVKCDTCKEVVFPEFLHHVRVPGFDEALDKLEADDLTDPRYDISGAYLECPACLSPISLPNLMDPGKRQWVHKFPDREVRGYQVQPFDVPAVNSITRTLKQLGDYEKKADWVNFKLGVPFQDAETSFIAQAVKDNTVVEWVQPRPGAASGCVLGCDVGKTSWIVKGKPVGRFQIDVIHLERVKQTGEGVLLARLLELIEWYVVSKAVIDAGPDFTTSMALVARCRLGQAWANYYVKNKSRNTLSHISTNEEEGIASTVRTESFDLLAKRVNSNVLKFPKSPEMVTMGEHLAALKRVEQPNGQGDMVANWVSTGPDHYGHALNYMNIADALLEDRFATHPQVAVLPMAVAARMKTESSRGNR